MHKAISFRKFRPAILVSNFNNLEAKWFRVALLGAHFSPLAYFRPIRVFNCIHEVRTDPTHLGHWHILRLAEHARLSGKTDIQGLSIDIFTELQIFVETHSVRPTVVPRAPHFLTLFQGPDSFLPIV